MQCAVVNDALRAAGTTLPPAVAKELESLAPRIIRRSLNIATETVRLRQLLDAAGIPVLVLKGMAVEQLAYASLCSTQTRDVDLLVPPDWAEEALHVPRTIHCCSKASMRMRKRRM